jgi:SRSO17 transposase
MAPFDIDDTLATVRSWADAFVEVEQQIGTCFARAEARQQALAYLRGLLSPAERKNSWQLAEMVGAATPYGFQHLLGRADWNADTLRDALYRYVGDHLGDDAAVIVLDETGFLKKGTQSVGVARQYSGTAGRIENCQIGVFLAYVSGGGHTLLDRELYLPKAWADDGARRWRAGIPPTRSFATKPQLARQMLARVFAMGIPVAWVTGDSIYGDDRRLRTWLEAQQCAYVLAVSGKEYVWQHGRQQRVTTLLKALPDEGWARISAGDGAKGPRWYEWLLLPVADPPHAAWRRWLLVRRNINDAPDVTAYMVYAPATTPLAELVRVAGSRWAIEVCFEAAKSEVGLDQYEVRGWTGWYRHSTLAMWAHAMLTVVRATTNTEEHRKKGLPTPALTSSLAAFKIRRGL